jgi:hypothetical protein
MPVVHWRFPANRLNSQRLRVRETQNKSPGTQVAGEPGLRGIGAGQRRGRLGGAAPIIETENGVLMPWFRGTLSL